MCQNFIAGSDYNARHVLWGSRLINPGGSQLHNALIRNRLTYLSPPTPTYRSTDSNRLPDLLDFFVCRGVTPIYSRVDSLVDCLSSDHSSVLLTLGIIPEYYDRHSLSSDATDWDEFRELKNVNLPLHICLKTGHEIEDAVTLFTETIEQAVWTCSPLRNSFHNNEPNYPLCIRQIVQNKRRWQNRWQCSRIHQPSVNCSHL